MHDAMSEVENAKAQHDLGVTAYRLYSGARSEGASRLEAFQVIWAWFGAMFETAMPGDDHD